MWEKIIRYCSEKHLLVNFIMLTILIGGVFFWHHTPKEELPNMEFDFVRISAYYPGASPSEVEHFITKPIEDAIKGIDGIDEISSTSNEGSSSISVQLEQNYADRDECIIEIRNAVMDVRLPDEVIDEPRIREFKTSKKAIIDIALFDTTQHLLDYDQRKKLQSYVRVLENQLLALPQVSEIGRSGYLDEEIQIHAYPEKLMHYNISFNKVRQEIQNNNVRQPAGSIEDKEESKVTLSAELDDPKKLSQLVIEGGFEGQAIRLNQLADVSYAYEKNKNILKINGHEGIILNVVKSSSSGILESVDVVNKKIKSFADSTLKNSDIKIVPLDDESITVRNRLSIVQINGAIGFIFILIMLFIFLDFKSGLYVALGIPFSFCFAMIFSSLFGFTINNITLAAVIIVMGMVVDDAIVVAENIIRLRAQGINFHEATVRGTSYVLLPIIASIITTCVAFIPLFFFPGRFGKFNQVIPPIIFLMLAGSLFESIFILPSHMNIQVPRWLRNVFSLGMLPLIDKYYKKNKPIPELKNKKIHWFHSVEDVYGKIMEKILKLKLLIFLIFIGLMVFAGFIFMTKMKFVMFPREETMQVSLVGEAHPDTKRYETARMVQPLEKMFSEYIGKEVIGFRTQIARSRRGSAVEENKMRMRIELVSKEKRDKSSKQLIGEWKEKMAGIPGFTKLDFQKHRFGHASGSPIEVIIQENDDEVREKVVAMMVESMEGFSALDNIEVDRPLKRPEYKVDLKRKLIKRLGINPSNIKNTFRTLLEGNVLYEVFHEDEEIKVRLTAIEEAKDDIKKVLNVPVENKSNYLVPLKNIVDIKKIISPNSISRKNYIRTTTIDADLSENTDLTPVEVAEHFEKNVLPQIISQYPTAGIVFEGEVKETRESQNYFKIAIFMVLFLIYVVLSLLFDSLVKPLLIMVSIPFGIVGIIFAFWAHGITLIGYFAAIGALGLAGVVVNDSIIMLVKLDKEYDRGQHRELSNKQIANIAKTRLRAVILTTLTTVAGLFPTAYGIAGYDAMLADMMLAMSWGLLFSTFITLLLIPCLYGFVRDVKHRLIYIKKFLVSRNLFIFLLLILCSSVFLEAKETDQPQVLPLPEFVTRVCTNDITFQEILIDQLTITYTSFLTLPVKDWIFSLKSQHDTVISGDSTTSPTNSVSLGKLFPAIGTNLSIDYDLSGNPSSTESSSSFSVLVSQPLAENAFGKTNRYLKKITGIEETVANHQIVEAYEDYLAGLITLYYNWYFAYENLGTAEASYQESLKQLDNMLKREKNNIALAVDVNKIRLQVLAKKERVIALADNFDQTHNLIKQAVGEKNKSEFLPEKNPSFYKGLTRSFEKEYAIFKEKSRTSKILELLEKKSGLELSKDKNALLPSLNLSFGYSRDGSEYRITDEDSFVYTMISLEFPYKATQEKAAYEISKVNRRKAVLSSKNKHINLYTDLLNLYDQIEKTKTLITNAQERIELAQSILKDEQRNYTLGQATLNDLIAAINKQEDNRFNKIAYSVQLKLLVTEWFRLTDQLVTPKEINQYKKPH